MYKFILLAGKAGYKVALPYIKRLLYIIEQYCKYASKLFVRTVLFQVFVSEVYSLTASS